MTDPIIYIVDDDLAVRDSVGLLCETAGLRPECHASAESFLAAYRGEQAGCLLLDARMERMSGPELHAELKRRGSRLPVIFLTAHGDIPMTVRAMKEGAMDFLTKPVDGADLLARIKAAVQADQDRRRRDIARSQKRELLAQLTEREQEILTLVLAGHANKSIAKQLAISHRTVEIHRSHILQKTGAANMLELSRIAAL